MSDWGEKQQAWSEAKSELLLALSEATKGRSDPYVRVQEIRLTGHPMTDGFEGVLIEEMVKRNTLMRLKNIEYSRFKPSMLTMLDEPAVAVTSVGLTDLSHELEISDSHVSKIKNGKEQFRYISGFLAFGVAKLIPASDRIVLKSDNQDAADEARVVLDEIQSELASGSNEIGQAFGDNIEIASTEISVLTKLVMQARIRADAVLDFGKSALGWIAEKAGTAAVGDLAKRALKILIDWLAS